MNDDENWTLPENWFWRHDSEGWHAETDDAVVGWDRVEGRTRGYGAARECGPDAVEKLVCRRNGCA
jgi:hypothetical protein